MATAITLPLEAYLLTSYDPDAEYVDGEVELRPMGELDHATWQLAILRYFLDKMTPWNIRVRCELRVQVTPTNYRIPDVVVWDRSLPTEPILTQPPLAVFEVMSPEDTYPRIVRKLRDYAGMGIQGIFIVEPRTGIVSRYGRDHSLTVSPGQVSLEGTPVVVDWDAISALRDL